MQKACMIDAPGYKVTSSYGMRVHPVSGVKTMHNGVDIVAQPTDQYCKIISPAYADVSMIGFDNSRGNYIILNHEDGYETRYYHLRSIYVKKGMKVTPSDTIGIMGTTGQSTGVHLHWEVLKNGVRVDPAPYIEGGFDLTQEQFDRMADDYMARKAKYRYENAIKSEEYKEAIQFGKETGLMQGSKDPNKYGEFLTRQDAILIIQRLVEEFGL